jgi:hypothetical protein
MLGGRELARFDGRPLRLVDIPGTEPIRIELDGQGDRAAVFFDLDTSGVPTDEAFAPQAAGLEVERELLRRDGSPVADGRVTQGELLVQRTRVRSTSGALENVAVETMLPGGLEVENPRLRTSEAMAWLEEGDVKPDLVDFRGDRVLAFTSLPKDGWVTVYTLLRAVTPGAYRLPPVEAKVMYRPSLAATGPRGSIQVVRPKQT